MKVTNKKYIKNNINVLDQLDVKRNFIFNI